MKLSIAWIFDHIDADWRSVDINELLEKFNKTTAEIERYTKFAISFDKYYIAQVKNIEKEVDLFIPELNISIKLPHRKDCKEKDYFFIKKDNDKYTWATLVDFYCEKDGLVSAISPLNGEENGRWRKQIENDDYIIEVDNKSITHRPDMWGHRGFAREIAAIFNLSLKPFDQFLVEKKIKHHEAFIKSKNFSIFIKNSPVTKTMATLSLKEVDNNSSSIHTALRLLKIGSRPINFIVDATNFVMFDIGQPMHAFDTQKIDGSTLIARNAQPDEKLLLLDDQEIKLSHQDCVIADEKKVLSLAGVMGGKSSGISKETKNIILESCNFDATTIRHTSARYKQRTEASSRFEKTLDLNQNIYAIKRFLKLLEDDHISYQAEDDILSLGDIVKPKEVSISHDLIQQYIGVNIKQNFVVNILQKLEFNVSVDNAIYKIIVPTFRSSKDVEIKQDIIEEIVRFFGYDNIPYILPKFQPKGISLSYINRIRNIKHFLAFGLQMQEVSNYAFYDESFLKTLQWKDTNLISAKNPVSENWKSLVTSLIPHLLKNILDNRYESDSLNFFEWGRIWKKKEKAIENKSLAGIFFKGKENINFYDGKQSLEKLFALLDMPVSWRQVQDTTKFPWYMPFQTAELVCNGNIIGRAGKAHPQFLEKVTDGDVFMFELDSNALLLYRSANKKYSETSKYQPVNRDISMLIPLHLTVDYVASLIATADARIVSVDLIDFFQKKEWNTHKSVTMRLVLQDDYKTLTKEDVDFVYNSIVSILCEKGAEIR